MQTEGQQGSQRDAMLRYGAKVARNVTIATFLLASVKIVLAKYTGSVSILADSYHSFSDLIPIVAAWMGLRIARMPRNERFPYGYYKAENLAAFLASIFIFILSYEIIMESISCFHSGGEVTHTMTGIVLTMVFVAVSFSLYRYQIKAAEISNSQAMLANARETKMDVFSSILVLVAFSFSSIGYTWVGGVVGLFLAGLVIHAGYESMKDAILSLMDAGISEEEMEKIRRTILEVPRVKEVKSMMGRRSGPFVMVEVEISVPDNLNVNQAHMVATEVEKRLTDMKEVDHATVHVEPSGKKHRLVAIPMDEDGPATVFGAAPYFDIITYEKNRVIKKERVENPGYNMNVKRGVKAALFLIEKGVDEVKTGKIGDDSREILEDAGVVVKLYKNKI